MIRFHVAGRTAVALTIAAAFAVSGCKFLKKTPPDAGAVAADEDTSDAGADAETAVVDAAPPPVVHGTDDNLPTPTAEEQKATLELSGTNYKDELDKVEKDMQTEK